MQYPKMLNSA